MQKKASSIGEQVSELDQEIWAVYQDQKNNYWFGSNGNGLFHYDGKIVKRYSTKDGLLDNTIRGIQEDHLGNLFIETPRGISKYDGKNFLTLQLLPFSKNEWKLEHNDLWFNCNGNPNDIYRFDGESLYELTLPRKDLKEAFGVKEDTNFSPYAVYGIDKDKAGNLWIGTVVAGAYRYDGNSFLWFAEKELTTLPDGRVPGVRSMLEDKEGFMWLSNFISKYKISEHELGADYEKQTAIAAWDKHFPDRLPYFNSGLSDKEGNLWMTTYTGGVWKYDGKELFNFPVYDGGTEALLISIYEDHEGGLWLGTNNVGVFKFNGKEFGRFEP